MKGVYERNCPLVDFPGSLEVFPLDWELRVPNAGAWVQSLVGKVRSTCHVAKKKKERKKRCCPFRYHTVVLFVIYLYRIDVLTLFKVAASLYTKFLFMAKFGSRLVLPFH